MNKNNKLIIGAAQFGMDYGINNLKGKITKNEVFDVLNYAYLNGVNEIDTATNYGDSEKVIGNYLEKYSANKFKISTKISTYEKGLKEQLLESLERLKQKKISKLIFHSTSLYNHFKPNIRGFIEKNKGLYFDEIGVSIYKNEEIKNIIEDPFIDRVQSPFNLLDNLSQRGEYFKSLKKNNKKIDIRSVFLQGLFYGSHYYF